MNIIKTKKYENLKYNESELALITHYSNNKNNGVSKHYETKVKNIVKKYNYNDLNTLKVSDVALQYNIESFQKVPFPSPDNYKFTFIDLFAGIGGFRLALQNIGGKSIFSSEWDENAKKTYFANFGEYPFGDITKEETKKYIPSKFDVLCAGFPCQPFSIAGERKGFSDTRGNLFFDIEKIIYKHRPKAIFLENVKNFMSHDKGNTFKTVKEILEDKLNYKIFYQVLNSMEYANIPQNRERIFIVGFDPLQVPKYNKFKFPQKINLNRSIHTIIDNKKQAINYYYNDHKYYDILNKEMTSKDTIYQWRRVYVRENKKNVCPTLTANMGTGGHNVPLIRDNYGIRKLTPKECFLFQGFPKEFVFPNLPNSKLYMQAGNTITVPLVELIAHKIKDVIL